MFINISLVYSVQDQQLRFSVVKENSKNWKKIAANLPGRTDVQARVAAPVHLRGRGVSHRCHARGLVPAPVAEGAEAGPREGPLDSRGKPAPRRGRALLRGAGRQPRVCVRQEDAHVIQLVAQHGTKRWSLIAGQLNGRLGKQCRER